MTRLPAFDVAGASPEQRRIYERIAAAHGGNVRGPWLVALRVPEVAEQAHALYERLCRETKVGKRLFELMVIVVARRWTSQFEWFAHERQAREHGVAEDVIAAIRDGREPPLTRDDERLVYEVTTELSATTRLSDATYARAQAALGDELLVELIAGIGFYTMIAMLLNAFDVAVPGGAQPLSS